MPIYAYFYMLLALVPVALLLERKLVNTYTKFMMRKQIKKRRSIIR